MLNGRLMRIYGHSMSPTLNPGELVWVNEKAYVKRVPKKGEVVAVRPASLGGKTFVKRIVGIPNECMRFDGKEWQLESDQFFLMGDQSDNSMDSRVFGPVDLDELIGPVRVCVWPWRNRRAITPG